MQKRELIATAQIPGGAELSLLRRGGEYTIALGGGELMSSRQSGSEEALALLTCARLGRPQAAHLLIGGYGMGFTLRAALGALGPQARVDVAELVPEIIDWARAPMQALSAGCLDDARVRVIIGDVADAMAAGRYDAILLDVDNGPAALTRGDNNRLYSRQGLAVAKAALKPGGALAIWSAHADAAFTRRLKGAGFIVEEIPVRARSNGKGARHMIWFATRT